MTLFEGILALFIRQYNESALTLNSVYTLMYLLLYQETDVLPTCNEESQSAFEMLQMFCLLPPLQMCLRDDCLYYPTMLTVVGTIWESYCCKILVRCRQTSTQERL